MLGPQNDSETNATLAKKLEISQKLNEEYRQKTKELLLLQKQTEEKCKLMFGAMITQQQHGSDLPPPTSEIKLKSRSNNCNHVSKIRELEESINEKDDQLAKFDSRIRDLLLQVEDTKQSYQEQMLMTQTKIGTIQENSQNMASQIMEYKKRVHDFLSCNSMFGLIKVKGSILPNVDLRVLVKDHWVPDSANESCDSKFSLTIRKHHCRQCGDIFCSNHLQLSEVESDIGIPMRIITKVCSSCLQLEPVIPQ